MVGGNTHVVLIQVFRHLGVGKHLLLEVLAPVAPHRADQEKDGFAFPLRRVECRRRMLHEPHFRRRRDIALDVRGAREDRDDSERESEEEPP